MEECYIEIYVDAENASHKKIDEIVSYVRVKYTKRYGRNIRIHIYKRREDDYTKNWDKDRILSELSEENQKNIKIIEHNLDGKPEKNKVDSRIIEDIEKRLDAIQLFILISSDGDYCEVVRKIHEHDGEICVIGDETASSALKETADEFIAYQDLKEETVRIRDNEKRREEEQKRRKEAERRNKEQAEKERKKSLKMDVQCYIMELIDNQWMNLRELKEIVEEKFPQFKAYHYDMSFRQFVEKNCNAEREGIKVIRKS